MREMRSPRSTQQTKMKPATPSNISAEAKLAALEKQIALFTKQPELAERRVRARAQVEATRDKVERQRIEVVRAEAIQADEKVLAGKVSDSLLPVRMGVERLQAAADKRYGRCITIDGALLAAEYLARTTAAKVASRVAQGERAKVKHAESVAAYSVAAVSLSAASAEVDAAAAAMLSEDGDL